MVASLFFALGGIGNTQPNLQVAEARPLKGTGWEIAPCKYSYQWWERPARVSTTISNQSGEDALFKLGDEQVVVIPANGNITYSFQVDWLHGQTERVRITKLVENQSGLSIQEALVLKIEPIKEGE
jgi:hypothetical protein